MASSSHRGLGARSLLLALLCLAPQIASAIDPNGEPSVNFGPPKSGRPQATPQNNDTVGNARLIVPDGSSVLESFGADTTKWYATEIEPGKTYSVEAFDPYADYFFSSLNAISIHDPTGTLPPPEAQVDCGTTATDVAPSLGQAAGYNGRRCIVRTFFPTTSTTLGKRPITIEVERYSGGNFQLRVRESTIYSRWTTNGYDFHVELQNTTDDPMCAYVLLYPSAGAGVTGTVAFYQINVPRSGANKVVVPAGTKVAGDNKGTLRIQACPPSASGGSILFNVGSLHVNTLAFNPVTKQFLHFFPWSANGAASANSF